MRHVLLTFQLHWMLHRCMPCDPCGLISWLHWVVDLVPAFVLCCEVIFRLSLVWMMTSRSLLLAEGRGHLNLAEVFRLILKWGGQPNLSNWCSVDFVALYVRVGRDIRVEPVLAWLGVATPCRVILRNCFADTDLRRTENSSLFFGFCLNPTQKTNFITAHKNNWSQLGEPIVSNPSRNDQIYVPLWCSIHKDN
jgi:hypothetical protein